MTETVRIEPLQHHDRTAFFCARSLLARTSHAGYPAAGRQLLCSARRLRQHRSLLAFAAASFPLLDLSTDIAKRLPRSGSLPGGLIGRLAVDRRFKDRRLGRSLILDATHRATRADPAIFALVVDAKDEAALGFYRHLGFQPFVSRPMSLLLPIATAIKALAALHGDYDAQFL